MPPGLTPQDIETFLAALLAETDGADWERLSATQQGRLPALLAARFAYDVRKGGFAQLFYNMKGNCLAELEDMLIAADAPIACDHYVQAVTICLENIDAYQHFLASNFTDNNTLRDKLHAVSLGYFAKRTPFEQEASAFLAASMRGT